MANDPSGRAIAKLGIVVNKRRRILREIAMTTTTEGN